MTVLTVNRFQSYILTLFFAFVMQLAQAQQMGITPVKIEKELPSLTVNRTFQDKDGYIWFGTAQGLSRFDAHNLLNFKLKNRDGRVADDQNISEIAESGDHVLLATANGLYTLHKQTFAILPFANQAIDGQRITALMIDRAQHIWVGSRDAIYVFRPDFSLLKTYKHHPLQRNTLPAGTVNTIFEDNNGDIWTGVWCAGLHKLNKKNNAFQAYPTLGTRNNPFKMFQDNHGQLWIASWGDGLFMFNPSDQKQVYREVVINNKRRGQGKEELCYNIVQDRQKKYIWVLSFSGISTFRYADGRRLEELDTAPLFSNTSNIFNDLYQDRGGALWLSIGGKGISTISFDKPSISHIDFGQVKDRYSISPNINMLYRDKAGALWFNLERIGLGKLAAGDGKMITYSNAQFKDLMAIRAVSCALEVDNLLWVGSSYEPTINLFRTEQDKITLARQIDLKKTAPEAGVPLFFFHDSKQQVWIATANGALLKRRGQDDLVAVPGILDAIVAITEDSQGQIWIATKGKGIYRLRQDNGIRVAQHLGRDSKGIYTEQIETMTADDRGNLWIGTKDSRLLRYDVRKGTAIELANANLFAKNQLLDLVYLDDVLWLSSTRNIYKILPHDNSIVEYAADDGLAINMFSKRAFTTDLQKKQVYFAGYNGAVVFDKSSFMPTHKPHLLVSDVKVNNVSSIMQSDKQKYNPHAGTLVLEPDDQNIEISFSSLEYTHQDKIRFAYKLEGVDREWIYAPRERLFATYNNLAKGRYRFLVKATDLRNKWSPEVTELFIEKRPALYESNIAYLLYTIAALALAYYAIRFYLNRLKLRSELRIAQIEKDNADLLIQTKLSYFTGISHDLLTPLTIISCLIDDVQMTTKTNLSQFEKMRFNLQRLKRLLQQVLDFRRIENRQMELRVSENDLDGFIGHMGNSYFSPLAKKKNIDFQIMGRASAGGATYFDADKLDKIIFNLLSNAFKYTGEGGTISLTYDSILKDGATWLQLAVRDTGWGIAADELAKIFVPFYNNRTAKHSESNGIGLALTKELVELHHGWIAVDSTPSKGSCFRIGIPLDRDSYTVAELSDIPAWKESLPDEQLLEEFADTVPSENSQSALNLLLVEDNEDLRQTIQHVLSRNYKVSVASNGEEALAHLLHEEIDIVISDIMMPIMDGLTLCQSIKSNKDIDHIPVILLTAKNSMDDRISCYQAGADGYISKPFEMKVLEARIHSFVINKRVRQADFKLSPQINISSLDYTPLDEQFVNKMIAVIEENLADDQFDVLILGDKLGFSKSTLYRKTKVLLDLSPSEFIKNIRLKHACQMMDQDKSISVSEVAFATGFSDPRYFSTCFKAAFNMTPSAYQRGGAAKDVLSSS